MNAESSENHLKAIKRILEEFERYDVLSEPEWKRLRESAKRELGHIDAIISYVHSTGNE